ncbi:AAA family ATPase [Microbacterium sp. cf332]|uniref:AAA family ATPase n=1 Tax=Microbacterium sp. cf332 TaxID=1761804 RepID=UPI000886F930|nr:SMC family ATPase [Microbacterium sp. cf332]SDQ26745.1 exonuclease SbcC [Microbacterium sp. cf332]
MKLHRLELTGFGPFRETQTVDFDAFDRDGVFLISGRTGAGKSSILDGVSFALYGSVPRYDNGERRLRSDHSFLGDPTQVRLEFTVGGERWRVTRAPEYERPAKRGDKLTTEVARAEVEQFVDGDWVGRAAKPREAALLLDEVLGLNAQQFQQVILLAQNKFSRFLLARNDERQQLLRTLFDTKRFEQYKDDLEERRRSVQRELDAGAEQVRTLLDLAEAAAMRSQPETQTATDAAPPAADLGGRREMVDRALRRAEYRVEQAHELRQQAEERHTALIAAHAELVERARVLDELVTARRRLAELDDAAAGAREEEQRLDRARAAETLRATLERADRADEAVRTARRAADVAEARWQAVGGSDGDDIAGVVEVMTGDLARLSDALERERQLSRTAAERDAIAADIARLTDEARALAEQHALLPVERERLDTALAAAAAEAARADGLRERVSELAAQASAAVEAERTARALAAADDEYLRASAAADTAAVAVTDLLRRRVAGRAGELAADLVDGDPCPVCGSLEHPHPAPAADDGVSDDHLVAAESARDATALAAREAGERAAGLRVEHAATAARAGGRDSDELAALLGTAREESTSAERAIELVVELTGQRDALESLDADAARERARLDAALATARERSAVAATEHARLEREVAAARATFDAVADRIAALTERRDRARALLDARAVLREAEAVVLDALADRDARVVASAFPDVAAVHDALLPEAERTASARRVAAHAAEVSATRSRLLELELVAAGLSDEAPDLDASAAAVAAGDAARTSAIASHRDAVNAAERLYELTVRIDDAFSAVSGLADRATIVTRLADTVAGRAPNTRKMDLETFVLAAELEEIVAAANLRLRDMSSGRYTLHHSDALQARGAASGLGLEVLDAHTGRLRSPQSLSGGETFLASLALALGLAEVVTGRAGGIRLDTLFVDEGFGSLDPETLELAMRTLDELRVGGRIVGVISHVEGMKEQLAAQIVVEATREGPSVIRQDAHSRRD